MARSLNLLIKVWRQASANAKGHFQDIEAANIPETASSVAQPRGPTVTSTGSSVGKPCNAFIHQVVSARSPNAR